MVGANRSVVVPTNRYPTGPNEQFRSDVVVAIVGQNAITEKGRIAHPPISLQPPTGIITVPVPLPLPTPIAAVTTVVVGQVPVSTAAIAPPVPTTIPPQFVQPSPIRRSLVVADRLVTVSATGVKVSDFSSLAELGWTPFGR